MTPLRVCLIVNFLVLGYLCDQLIATPNGQPYSNLENLFADEDDLYNQYQQLNTAVKRQSKGSCSCTCETKPIVRYTDEEKDGNHSQKHNKSADNGKAERKGHVATILRTGGLKAGSQNPIWSFAGHDPYNGIPEVGGVNLKEDLPEVGSRIYDSNEYEGSDLGNYEQEKQSSESNRNSDIGWGHGSRFPWLHLPNEMCFRQQCSSNLDCCRKFNLCDKSASVCVDCWYGSTCTSEAQCCEKYPYCEMVENDLSAEPMGRCVNAL